MAFRKGGAKRRRDLLEPAIVQALRAVGCETWQVSGRGLPDLLVRRQGQLWAFEVKSGKAGKLTVHQGAFPVICTVDEALAAVGAFCPECGFKSTNSEALEQVKG